MPLTFAQYETLFGDATLAPRIKVFASRLLRDYNKATPNSDPVFLDALSLLSNPAFLERVRVHTLGNLDDAGVATPTVPDIAAAARQALRDCLNLPTL